MIKDRLPELKDILPDDTASQYAPTADDEEFEDFEEIDWIMLDRQSFAEPLIKRYAAVRNHFDAIKSNVGILKSMVDTKNADKFDEDEFNKMRQRNSQLSNIVMAELKKLEFELPEQIDYRTQARMQRALYYGHFQQYVQLWDKHKEVLQKYEEQLKENLQHQAKIMNYDFTEEEIDILAASQQTNLLIENILTDTETGRQKLQDHINLFRDLVKLENSVTEVNGLFIRLQTLVMEQGDMVQRIENHFDNARDYVSEGLEQIKRAEELLCENIFRPRQSLILVGSVLTAFLVACSAVVRNS